MKLWVGVTDNDWFDFLSRSEVDEVNFWQPSGRAPFVGLESGAPFLFKLKRPHNHIAGAISAELRHARGRNLAPSVNYLT